MGFQIIYKNLFEVHLLHHYFLNMGMSAYDAMSPAERQKVEDRYDVRNFIRLTPTADTMKLLQACRCIFKATPKGFLVGIKAEKDKTLPNHDNPFIAPAEDAVFRFAIYLLNPFFNDFTALPVQEDPESKASVYVFKNFKAERQAIFPSLSAVPPLYKASVTYQPGDMLVNDANNPTRLFTALYKTSNSTSNTTDWLAENSGPANPIDYANINDRYPVVTGILNYTMKVPDALPVLTLKNPAGKVLNPEIVIVKDDYYSLQADLRNLPEGLYSLHIESNPAGYQEDRVFYLMHQPDIPFGLIEIRVKSDLAGYDLLDDGHLRSPVFRLRFRNRRTHWRYSGKNFDPPFVLDNPLPLTRFGTIEVEKPPGPGNSESIPLPNPSDPVMRPEALINAAEKKYYSDIHII